MKSFDLAAAKKAIDSANAVFGLSLSKGDSVGLASLYFRWKIDGRTYASVTGKRAIQSTLQDVCCMGTPGLTLTSNEFGEMKKC